MGLYVRGGYRAGFGVLLISAMLCLATLIFARVWHPRPHKLEESSEEFLETKGFSNADVISVSKRSTGFGLFYTVFGVGWFLGSALMGFLYDESIVALILFSVVRQLIALTFFFWGTATRKT